MYKNWLANVKVLAQIVEAYNNNNNNNIIIIMSTVSTKSRTGAACSHR